MFHNDLPPITAKTQFTFFWRQTEQNGYMSNWYHSPFNIGLHTFPTSEHYMMWGKAILMGDLVSTERILAATSPAQVKKLGQQVSPWNEELWLGERLRIMYEACLAKFETHADLRDQLIATGNSILVEASPMDRIWGIGMSETNPNARDPTKWKGLNLLGLVLMRVRDVLQE